MKRFTLLAAGASVFLCPAIPLLWAAGDESSGALTHPAVAVFLDFDSKPGDNSIAVMKREAEDLLKASGIALDWKMVTANQGKESSPGLVVVKFRGRCRVEGWPQPGEDELPAGTETLGFTRVSDGHVMPFSEIECDSIRKSLSYLAPDSTPMERQRAFGLAMGRVVAHELYHMLARTTSHAEEGLAKATQSLRDLVGNSAMAFRETDSREIGRAFVTQ